MKVKLNLDHRKVYSYDEYRSLMKMLVNNHMTTGEQTEGHVHFTALNDARMNRWDKTYKPSEEIIKYVNELEKQSWIILVEAWCGDAAQNLPIIAKLAEGRDNIELKIILRDENLDIMDQFLTNGGRSIPKLIALDSSSELLFSWGPRPTEVQEMFYKMREAGALKEEWDLAIHTMYAKTKGAPLERDFIELFESILKA